MKLRINMTVEDYYDYIGTNPYYSKKERVLQSLPLEFNDSFSNVIYNLKFKEIKSITGRRHYRVHFSANMTEEDLLKLLIRYENYCHKPEKVSYRVITKGCNVH